MKGIFSHKVTKTQRVGQSCRIADVFTNGLVRCGIRLRRTLGCVPSGFSLVELLIAMAVSSIVLSSLCAVFAMQNKSYAVQEQVAEMQQSARASMDIMVREIRMAGYDPSGADSAGIVSATANYLRFTQDLNGDGDTADPNEDIAYSIYTSGGIQKIGRSTSGGVKQPLAEHAGNLSFSYFDGNGSSTAIVPDIRQVRVTVEVRTAEPDPCYSMNGGYRTRMLSSTVTPRNLTY